MCCNEHTGTHCNTLPTSTLQLTATHCDALQRTEHTLTVDNAVHFYARLYVSLCVSVFAGNYGTYVFFRFVSGIGCGAGIVVNFVLMMEFVGAAHRGWMGGFG